jgi:hypothetical protein
MCGCNDETAAVTVPEDEAAASIHRNDSTSGFAGIESWVVAIHVKGVHHIADFSVNLSSVRHAQTAKF